MTMHRSSAIILMALIAFLLIGSGLVAGQEAAPSDRRPAGGEAPEDTLQFNLAPAADNIAACYPEAAAAVTVALTADQAGTDSFRLSARGLRPHTTFAVFLTEQPVPPFGAVEYIGDLITNGKGKATLVVNAIIGEAFSSQLGADGQRVRKELNHVVFWFADPTDADGCFAPGKAPVTPFDGDGQAGPAAMSSKNYLPGAPLP
jgi:hypothetical protein